MARYNPCIMAPVRIEFVHPEGRCRPVETIVKLHYAGKLRRWRPNPAETGDCEESTFDLAVDLVENGHTDFVVAQGDVVSAGSRVRHMWLEWEGLILDVSNGGVRRGKYLANYGDVMLRIWQPANVQRWPAAEFAITFVRA